MNYRERFAATINHQAADRVPFDLAGTSLTGIEHASLTEKLKQLLGFAGSDDSGYSKFDERILKYLDIDFRRVGDILEPESPLAGRRSAGEYTDCWGVTRVFTGLYWEIKHSPLKDAGLEDLDTFPWPEPGKIDRRLIDGYREQAKRLCQKTDYVVCAEHPFYGVMELGCWMCGFDTFLMKMALEPEFVLKFFDKILAYQKQVIEIYYGALGDYIHLTTSGDDFGTQTGPFISPDMFRELVAPYYQERIRHTRKFTQAAFFHHTCGSVFALIPQLIAAGVDILNPIQPGARDMEPARLKQAYGGQITFWGGIDTQSILPGGTAAEVKQHVGQVLDAISDRGGYVLAPAHNIQPDVPPENILAIYQAGKDYFSVRSPEVLC
ncbi:MAG TPA: methyltransferase [Clostridiales bacterium]|nr:methyltransferase [Clostridiales bacterium]